VRRIAGIDRQTSRAAADFNSAAALFVPTIFQKRARMKNAYEKSLAKLRGFCSLLDDGG
jgi:hypothetical protein